MPTGVYSRKSIVRITKTCQKCSKTFLVHPCRETVAKFCSKHCSNSRRKTTAEYVSCEFCKTLFHNRNYQINAVFCSRKCSSLNQVKNERTCIICQSSFIATNLKEGNGKYCSRKCYAVFRKTLVGDKGYNWLGDDVGYSGLHIWVKKNLGKPPKCEHCEKDNLFGKAIHWANKDHKYRRNLEDWIRLCAACHTKYDIEMGFRILGVQVGYKHTLEARKNMSLAHIGQIPWNKKAKSFGN